MKITLNGHTAVKGISEGEALVCRTPFMFLSYVNLKTGVVFAGGHELEGKSVKDKVMVFPCGKGSMGDEPSLSKMKRAGVAPKAIVAGSAIFTPGVIGAILADIPMVYGFDRNCLGVIDSGDHVKVDAHKGTVEVTKRESPSS